MTTETPKTDVAQLTEEEMKLLASQVNANKDDVTLSDAENAARKAAAAAKEGDNGSKSSDDLAAEAAKFMADKAVEDAATAAEDATVLESAEDPEEAADEPETVDFPDSDDPGLKAALNLMKAGGMTGEDVQKHFAEAIKTGDISKVDQKALKEKLGEDAATLVMAGVTKWSVDAGEASLAAIREVQDAVGGAQNWSTMTQWAKHKAKTDPKFKAEIAGITDMLNGTGTARKLGAQEFKRLYNADPNNSSVGTKKTVEGDGASQAAKIKPMTGTEAYKAKETLNRQRQLGKVTQAEYNAGMAKIQAARNAAR